MSMTPAIGQRWIWNKPDRQENAVAEVISLVNEASTKVKIIQDINGKGISGFFLGRDFTASFSLNGWSYLQGQDAPIKIENKEK